MPTPCAQIPWGHNGLKKRTGDHTLASLQCQLRVSECRQLPTPKGRKGLGSSHRSFLGEWRLGSKGERELEISEMEDSTYTVATTTSQQQQAKPHLLHTSPGQESLIHLGDPLQLVAEWPHGVFHLLSLLWNSLGLKSGCHARGLPAPFCSFTGDPSTQQSREGKGEPTQVSTASL